MSLIPKEWSDRIAWTCRVSCFVNTFPLYPSLHNTVQWILTNLNGLGPELVRIKWAATCGFQLLHTKDIPVRINEVWISEGPLYL